MANKELALSQEITINKQTQTGETLDVATTRKKLDRSLARRISSFKSKWLRLAFVGAMGFASEPAAQNTEQMPDESAFTPATEEALFQRDIAEAVGPGAIARLNRYTESEPDLQAYREELRDPEHPRASFAGFERLGYSSEEIRELTETLIPPDWMTARNIQNIEVIDGEIPMSYHLEDRTDARAAGDCSSSFIPGEASMIRISKTAVENIPEKRRLQYLMQLLTHEAAHANEPLSSSTLDPETRTWAMHWMTERVQTLSATSEITSDIYLQRMRNEIAGFTGDTRALPAPGEGALPFSYPRSIEDTRERFELAHRYQEYYAETMAIIMTLRTQEQGPNDSSTWEERTARALLVASTFGALAVNWRTDDEAYQDALEHVRFVQRMVPDIEERQAQYNATLARMETDR
ncbi:MAG: hypothetical protein WCK01_04305 [Candidatus Uhrbacteria bacterium]